ncbi:MAG: hypothetical protein U1G05_03800 [Kiritimatiellia bacterium]
MPQVFVQSAAHRVQRALPGQQDLVEHGVVVAVHHPQFATGGRAPAEDAVGRQGHGAAEVPVDRHDEEIDAVVEQQVRQGPGHAVDVVLERGANGGAELSAQREGRGELACELVAAVQGRDVAAHGADGDPPGYRVAAEALHLRAGCAFQPFQNGRGDLAGPFGARAVVGPVRRAVEEIQGEIDVLPVHLHRHRLRMRVADVEVAVVKDEDFPNGRHVIPPEAA